MQRPVLGAHQQAANRRAIQQTLQYGHPPHMAAGTLGFSGHREPHRADNPALAPAYPIPPAMPSPFPDAYSGVKTLKFLKMIFHSSNNTSRSTENADFTVQIDKEVLNNINVGMISLSDIVFPAGQYLIEDEWSRLDVNEGIVPTASFRDATVVYPDRDDPHTYRLVQNGQLPLKANPVEAITVEDDARNVYRFRTAAPFGASIGAVQAAFDASLAVVANRFRADGTQPMGTAAGVAVQGVTSALPSQRHLGRSTMDVMTHEFRAQLDTNITAALALLNDLPAADLADLGYLVVANLASPLHLAAAVTAMLQAACVFRVNRFDAGDAELVADHPRLAFNVHWNAASDRFYLTYSARVEPEEMPTLEGEVFEYMGFPVPYRLPRFDAGSLNKTIAAPGRRQTNVLSGTRVLPGHYLTGAALAGALETGLNATWFGRADEAANAQNPSPFQVALRDAAGRVWAPLFCAGRYTPHELAAAFNAYMADAGQPFRMAPVFRDSIVYVGMKVYSEGVEGSGSHGTTASANPFTLLFASSTRTTLDPARLGYARLDYGGATTYFPVAPTPRIPTPLQGCLPTLVPVTQHYAVDYDDGLRRLSVTPQPFAPVLACVASADPDAQTVTLNLPVAHGAAAGQVLYLTKIDVSGDAGVAAAAEEYCAALATDACSAGVPALAAPLYAAVESGAVGGSGGASSSTRSALVLPAAPLDEEEWIHAGFAGDIVPLDDATGRKGALRPTQLTASYGGTYAAAGGPFAEGDLVYVVFAAPRAWGWDCSWNVPECVNRQVVGVDPAYYAFNTAYPISAPLRAASKHTLFVVGSDALANAAAPKAAVALAASGAALAYPSVNVGVVIGDLGTFNLPNAINLHPYKDVYLVVSLNRIDGDGTTIGIETVKETVDTEPEPFRLREPAREDASARGVPLVNGAQINALAHILVGPKHPDGIVDLNDRLFEIQYVGVQRIDSFRFQFLNPDGTYYKFHGREVSVGLLLSTIGEQVVTTQ